MEPSIAIEEVFNLFLAMGIDCKSVPGEFAVTHWDRAFGICSVDGEMRNHQFWFTQKETK